MGDQGCQPAGGLEESGHWVWTTKDKDLSAGCSRPKDGMTQGLEAGKCRSVGGTGGGPMSAIVSRPIAHSRNPGPSVSPVFFFFF